VREREHARTWAGGEAGGDIDSPLSREPPGRTRSQDPEPPRHPTLTLLKQRLLARCTAGPQPGDAGAFRLQNRESPAIVGGRRARSQPSSLSLWVNTQLASTLRKKLGVTKTNQIHNFALRSLWKKYESLSVVSKLPSLGSDSGKDTCSLYDLEVSRGHRRPRSLGAGICPIFFFFFFL